MRSMEYVRQEQLRMVEHPEPRLGPADVLLRVEACGVCGSDVASYVRGHYVEEGQVLGHEMSAVVAAAGAVVRDLQTGSRVAVQPSRSCGRCTHCLADQPYLCNESRQRTLGYGERGGLADFVVIRDVVVGRDVIVVSDDLLPEEVLWAEPLAVAVHAVRRAGIGSSSRVLVIGAGSVGLCLVAAATAAGAGNVVVVEPRRERRTAAASLGAATCTVEELAALGPDLFEVALDASGSANAIAGAVPHLSGDAVITLVGLGDMELPWPVGSCDIRASFAYTNDDFRVAVDYIASGRVRLGQFVSHRYPLEDTGRAIAASAQDSTVIKAAVFPGVSP